jgi:hypothetical protein
MEQISRAGIAIALGYRAGVVVVLEGVVGRLVAAVGDDRRDAQRQGGQDDRDQRPSAKPQPAAGT